MKDDVDYKELEKIGFETAYDNHYAKVIDCGIAIRVLQIFFNNRNFEKNQIGYRSNVFGDFDFDTKSILYT